MLPVGNCVADGATPAARRRPDGGRHTAPATRPKCATGTVGEGKLR